MEKMASWSQTKCINVVWMCEDCYSHPAQIEGVLRWRSYPKIDHENVAFLEWFIIHKEKVPQLLHRNDDWLYIASNKSYSVMLVATDYRPEEYTKMVQTSLDMLHKNKDYFDKVVKYYVEFCIDAHSRPGPESPPRRRKTKFDIERIEDVDSDDDDDDDSDFDDEDERTLKPKSSIGDDDSEDDVGLLDNGVAKAELRLLRSNEFELLGRGVKLLAKAFELDIILIYTAVLLRKRIIIYDHDTVANSDIFDGILGLNFKDRKNLLAAFHPNIDPDCTIQNDLLRGKPFYIVSSSEYSLHKQTSRFDLFINIPAKEIIISPQSKPMFAMTKVHKEIATTLVRICDTTQAQFVPIKIMKKNQEIITTIECFFEGSPYWKREHLNRPDLSNDIQEFYWNFGTQQNELQTMKEKYKKLGEQVVMVTGQSSQAKQT